MIEKLRGQDRAQFFVVSNAGSKHEQTCYVIDAGNGLTGGY